MKILQLLPLLILCVTGCSIFKAPPSKFDAKLYNIKTNYVEVVTTNIVPAGTFNVTVPVVDTVTGVTNYIRREGTNWTATVVTNRMESYIYENKPIVDTGSSIVSAIGGPWGVLIGGIAAGLYGLYGKIRSGKLQDAVDQGAQVAKVLVQNVEQVRGALRSTTGGVAADQEVMKQVKAIQTATDTKSDIHELVEATTDATTK